MKIHPDFSDFIGILIKYEVDFIMVGAFALAFLGYPRYTGDMDIWIKPTKSNAKSLIKAIEDFGLASRALTENDVLSGNIIQLGFSPVRIDLITELDGLTTKEIWTSRIEGPFGEHVIFYIGKDAFVKNKKAIGRHKDLADLEALNEL